MDAMGDPNSDTQMLLKKLKEFTLPGGEDAARLA
jgi:hypothetical protein